MYNLKRLATTRRCGEDKSTEGKNGVGVGGGGVSNIRSLRKTEDLTLKANHGGLGYKARQEPRLPICTF